MVINAIFKKLNVPLHQLHSENDRIVLLFKTIFRR